MHQNINSLNTYFKGKVVWITGASSGIGEQLAIQLSGVAGRLILSARREQELARVKALCSDPANVSVITLDLADEHSIRSAWKKISDDFGVVDVLFNNGGISQRSTVLDTPLDLERRMFEINFFSNILLSKLVASAMATKGSGHIVITSSLLGKWGFPLRASYSASKHALHGYYDSMRMELEDKGIHITLVTPGFIATDISVHSFDEKGNPTNVMDQNQANGLPAAECARQMITGTAAIRHEFAIGGKEVLGLKVKRFFPKMFERILRKQPAR